MKMTLSIIAFFTVICSAGMGKFNLEKNSAKIYGYSVDDSIWIGWKYSDPEMWDNGVVIFGSLDGKSWTPINNSPVKFNYDTVPNNELLPKSITARAKQALLKTQFRPQDITQNKKMCAMFTMDEQKKMYAKMMTSLFLDKYGYLASSMIGNAGIVIGKKYKYVGIASKGCNIPSVSAEVKEISKLVEVIGVRYLYPQKTLSFYIKDSGAYKSNIENGLAHYEITLVSDKNDYQGSLIPFVEKYDGKIPYRDIYALANDSTGDNFEHHFKICDDLMGVKVRITPTVLGIYEGEKRELIIEEKFNHY